MVSEFILDKDYIELNKLLKLLHIAQTGGHANIMIGEGEVFLNGEQESRKRAKLRKGDVVETGGRQIKIV
ncbi:MAG: RNA-binding S4 domain-containing protein [Draconibacterium sp.]